ncbi:MAG: hypothetical protein AAF810_02495 [Cyanobacteria bacterium P01_D01_bin.36]
MTKHSELAMGDRTVLRLQQRIYRASLGQPGRYPVRPWRWGNGKRGAV